MKTLCLFFFASFCAFISVFSVSAQQAPVYKVWDKTYKGHIPHHHLYSPTNFLAVQPNGNLFLGLNTYPKDKFQLTNIDPQGNILWTKSYENDSVNYTSLKSVILTEDGGCVMAGLGKGSDFGLLKVDANGNKLWDKTIGGTKSEEITLAVGVKDGGIVLAGISLSDQGRDKSCNRLDTTFFSNWIVKVDNQGNIAWDLCLSFDHGNSGTMIPTNDGGVLIGGAGPNNHIHPRWKYFEDYWILKLTANGFIEWEKKFGGYWHDRLYAVAESPSGEYWISGCSVSPQSWDKSEPATSPIRSDSALNANTIGGDAWTLKLDRNGNKIWDKTHRGSTWADIFPSYIIPSADGGALLFCDIKSRDSSDVSEPTRGEQDYWLLKVDAQGNKEWDKRYGGNKDEYAMVMVQGNEDEYYLGGWSMSDSNGDKTAPKGEGSLWIIKLSTQPNGITENAYSDPGLTVYPNPSEGTLTVNYTNSTNENCTLELFDAKGSIIHTLSVRDNSTELSGLASGLYLLRLTSETGKMQTRKIVVH